MLSKVVVPLQTLVDAVKKGIRSQSNQTVSRKEIQAPHVQLALLYPVLHRVTLCYTVIYTCSKGPQTLLNSNSTLDW